MIQRFELHREQDTTGVSGTGKVAEGVRLSSGRRHDQECSFVTTEDDKPPKGWVQRWRGWGGYVWFCPKHDSKTSGGG